MHELFMQVLQNRDLSRAGDLFSVPDSAIVQHLTHVLKEITQIVSQPEYAHNDNDQSVVEICVTRVTSCVRDTGTVEQHCPALVTLLEACLHHNLEPTGAARDEDPPHAKISADIISSIFLNYSKKSVMQRAIPVAVKFLHKGNKELSRNMASYLSLAAIDHAHLLSAHVQPIMDSLLAGNYSLCRVLAQLYECSRAPLQDHAPALVSLLPLCDIQEKLALLNLFAKIASNKPSLLEASVPQLCEYLTQPATAQATIQVFLNLAEQCPALLASPPTILAAIKQAAVVSGGSGGGGTTNSPAPPLVVGAVQVVAAVGRAQGRAGAQDALNFVLEQLSKMAATADRTTHAQLLREATLLCSSYPVLFTDKVLAGVRQQRHSSGHHQVNQQQSTPTTHSGGVTIVKVGGAATTTTPSSPPLASINNTQQLNSGSTSVAAAATTTNIVGYTRRAKLGDSRSTGRLHATSTSGAPAHRSMTRLNMTGGGGGGVGALHKSCTRLSSTTSIGTTTVTTATVSTTTPATSTTTAVVNSGGVTVTTMSQQQQRHTAVTAQQPRSSVTISHTLPQQQQQQQYVINSSSVSVTGLGLGLGLNVGSVPSGGGVTSRRNNNNNTTKNNNTSVTIVNANNNMTSQNRMSVFEPYPMRDTVQHFCEKHLDKIKAYMDKVSVRIPPPAKCTIEERRAKKLAKLHFACQTRGEHCLYARTLFTMRTRQPRIWIHLMFLALQAQRATHALSSRDTAVTSLKHCWDMLKCENKTFLTLVTSAFPCVKDQEALLSELRHSGFFDVFQLTTPTATTTTNNTTTTTATTTTTTTTTAANLQWACFLCTHPERAIGFLRGNTQPVIEGQLKEKKGRWRLFRRWRTRYFTLSGAHLSVKGPSGGESIDVNQIRSVKVSRGGARNIPKAFEIFTGDSSQSVILKPKDGKNAEEWVQCLSIVVAHSHSANNSSTGVADYSKSNSLPARSGIGAGLSRDL